MLDNHYHTLGYLYVGEQLGPMMRKIHGSVAKLVNDLLLDRRVPFWRTRDKQEYFDGRIRDQVQCRRAYRYTLRQSVRHGLCSDYREYRHTRVGVDLQRGIARALEVNAFLANVPYKRHQRGAAGHGL